MELTPGFYKIQRGDRYYKTFHYWRVFIDKGELYLKEDHGIAFPMSHEDRLAITMEGVKVITQYNNAKKPGCKAMKITVEFLDENDDKFQFSSVNRYTFRNIFDSFPWIKKVF